MINITGAFETAAGDNCPDYKEWERRGEKRSCTFLKCKDYRSQSERL
jgi:hypothetical protein